MCDFKLGGTGSLVSILLTSRGPVDSAEKTVAELKKNKIAAETVAGIGDSAYAASPGYGMQQLGVYKGASHVIVTVFLVGAPRGQVQGRHAGRHAQGPPPRGLSAGSGAAAPPLGPCPAWHPAIASRAGACAPSPGQNRLQIPGLWGL